MATTPKLYEAACKGTHLSQGGPDDGSDENFVYGGPENADGHAGRKGAWVADVTYERDLINLTGVNGLDGDHGGSTAPVEPRSYTAGHFALDIDGHSSSHLSFYDLIV